MVSFLSILRSSCQSYLNPTRGRISDLDEHKKMRTSLPLSLSLPLRLLLDLVHREIISQIAPLTDHSNLHQPFIFLVQKKGQTL